jgi:Ca2+-binding RTX toxin-like protein
MATFNGTNNGELVPTLLQALLAQGNDTINGLGGDDIAIGFLGNDIISGGAGADVIIGGVLNVTGGIGGITPGGIDTADYTTSGAGVQINLANILALNIDLLGINLALTAAVQGHGGDAEGDTLVGIVNLNGSAFADTLGGDSGVNVLNGGAGDDILHGGGGADSLIGGAGIDTADYSDSASPVTVNLQTGTGTGGDAQGDTLTGVEHVIGSGGNDTLIGSTGDDILTGGAGADALTGGGGNDVVDYSGSGAGVTVDLGAGTASGGDATGDTLTGITSVTGSAFADHLTGDAGANTINGGAGDDVLHGGGGADIIDGGAGNDFANYQGSAAGVTVDLLGHTASGGDAAGDVLTNIESLYGSSFDDHLTGDNGANTIGGELGDDVLTGNGGNDILAGEAGNDTLDGGDGDDRLVGGDGNDNITGGAGNDSIDGGAGTDTINGGDGNDTVVAGAGDDIVNGNNFNDFLVGGAGADQINGGDGIDTAAYIGSSAGVTVNLGAGTASGGDAQGDVLTGIENLYGSSLDDHLTGDTGNNTLWGAEGNDVLTGGAGADLLKGGAGNDTFVYTSIADSTVAPAGKDLITDFTTGDKIDLSAIDADGNSANGDTAFSFGTGGFTGHAGEVRIVDFGNGVQGVYLDTNGDKVPESIINVISDHALTASDFVL